MKLHKLILKLELLREKYVNKHGFEPEVYDIEADSFDNSMTIELCKKIVPYEGGGTAAKKPYLDKKIKFRHESRNRFDS